MYILFYSQVLSTFIVLISYSFLIIFHFNFFMNHKILCNNCLCKQIINSYFYYISFFLFFNHLIFFRIFLFFVFVYQSAPNYIYYFHIYLLLFFFDLIYMLNLYHHYLNFLYLLSSIRISQIYVYPIILHYHHYLL